MTRITIAEALQDLIIERAEEEGRDPFDHYIWQGDPDLLQTAYILARGRSAHTHPLNNMDAVMAAVRRSPLFERSGSLMAHSRVGMSKEVRYVLYRLRRQAGGCE